MSASAVRCVHPTLFVHVLREHEKHLKDPVWASQNVSERDKAEVFCRDFFGECRANNVHLVHREVVDALRDVAKVVNASAQLKTCSSVFQEVVLQKLPAVFESGKKERVAAFKEQKEALGKSIKEAQGKMSNLLKAGVIECDKMIRETEAAQLIL